MSDITGHEWEEVIPPRVYGGDSEPKHALQCVRCGKQLLVAARDIRIMAFSIGQETTLGRVVPCKIKV